jgi:4-hydroxy-tetrahydrodipicolinate reductase
VAIRICLAGATGWAGSELARAIAGASDLELVAAVSRSHAGQALGEIIGEPWLTTPVYHSAGEALERTCDVFVEYTHPDTAKSNVLAALKAGAHVVIGTSGLTAEDFAEIEAAASRSGRGVLACGNFSLTAVLLQRFAEIAAKLIAQWEIVDYAGDAKTDAPSGTARELAARLEKIRPPVLGVPLDQVVGRREARGATISGTQIHSVRLPGYTISLEAIFGMEDERLSIRHDAGGSARPYVEGALIAIRRVSTIVGLRRGLDAVLDLTP